MQVDGALVREQGITFGIIIVKSSAMSTRSEADRTRDDFQSGLAEFSGIPLILACQDGRGRFTYDGRTDIVNFLASIDASRIPWKTYTY